MKVLVDTNVVLDVLLARDDFVGPAAKVFALIEQSELSACLCATTITTIDYLLGQGLNKKQAREALNRLLELFEIATVNRSVIEEALLSKVVDFEDAVLERAALLAGADVIITRNTKDFKKSVVKGLEPIDFLSSYKK